MDAVDTYGADAVLGRTLYAHEIIRMNVSRKVFKAYLSRKDSNDWTEWAKKNEDDAELLAKVERLIND